MYRVAEKYGLFEILIWGELLENICKVSKQGLGIIKIYKELMLITVIKEGHIKRIFSKNNRFRIYQQLYTECLSYNLPKFWTAIVQK